MCEFSIKIANLYIKIVCNYETSKRYCEDYIVSNAENCDFEVKIDKSDLAYTLELLNKGNHRDEEKQDEYLEIISIHGKIAIKLPEFGKFIIHGAAISYKDKGYLFLAPSGTGKTTHINLWKSNLDGVEIINGDKPIISLENDKTYVYGTPWSGSERFNTNKRVKLQSIILLKRGGKDEIVEIDKQEVLKELLDKIYYPDSVKERTKTLELINEAFKNVKSYELKCTMNKSAFTEAYKALVEE